MSKKLDKETVRNVANLARLELRDDEIEKFTGQLGKILEYASDMEELNLDGVEPTSHVVPIFNVLRDDQVRPSMKVEDVLANAPDPLGDYFCVPKIIDEGDSH